MFCFFRLYEAGLKIRFPGFITILQICTVGFLCVGAKQFLADLVRSITTQCCNGENTQNNEEKTQTSADSGSRADESAKNGGAHFTILSSTRP